MTLETILNTVFNMSLTASVIALFVLAVRYIFRQTIPKTAIYILWAVVLIRLICPFTFTSALSVLNVLPTENVTLSPTENESLSKVEFIPPKSDHASISPVAPPTNEIVQSNPTQTQKTIELETVISVVWLVGCSVMIVSGSALYIQTAKKLRGGCTLEESALLARCQELTNVKGDIKLGRTTAVSTPVVSGVFKPIIFVPVDFDLEDTDTVMPILTHELIHVKRLDNAWKLIGLSTLSLHWFNPIIWVSYFCFIHDLESSCDEHVLKLFKKDIRGDYATSLLNLAVKQQSLGYGFSAFSESNLKKRVKGIMNYKSKSFLSLAISVLLLSVICVACLSNPRGEESNGQTSEEFVTEFVQNFLTLNYDEEKDMMVVVEERDAKLKPYFTDEALLSFYNRNSQFIPIKAIFNYKKDLMVKQIELKEEFNEENGDKVGYYVTADVEIGGEIGSQIINLSVVKEEGEWKIYAIDIQKVPTVLDAVVNNKPESDSELERVVRDELAYSLSHRVEYIEYLNEVDDLTKELTEVIFYGNTLLRPIDFANINETDLKYRMVNTALSTAPVRVEYLSDEEQIAYVNENKLDWLILREHLEKTAKYLYGNDVELPIEDQDGLLIYSEELNAYEIRPTSVPYINPVILKLEQDGDLYQVEVALPMIEGYSEYYRYENMDLDDEPVTLKVAVEKSIIRKMVLQRQPEGNVIIVSSEVIE